MVDDTDRWHYGSMVIAMTLVSALPADGWIADADIGLNTASYAFCTTDCQPMQPVLKDTLVHEAGHFFGLDHSWDKTAAMWTHADVMAPAGLALQPDDVKGICAIYGPEPPPCTAVTDPPEPDEGGGCGARGGQAGPPWSAALLLALLLGLIGRRRGVLGAGDRACRP